MLYIVDTVRTAPDAADAYLDLVRDSAVAIMRDAGAALAWCSSTARDLGEEVDIVIAWQVFDHARWNEIRRKLVLDPRWHRYGREAARLRLRGRRRFHHAAPFTQET